MRHERCRQREISSLDWTCWPSGTGKVSFEARPSGMGKFSFHRYCAPMTGSITEGEEVVQDALFRAYRSLETWDDSRPPAP